MVTDTSIFLKAPIYTNFDGVANAFLACFFKILPAA